jgi:hypothetical protein
VKKCKRFEGVNLKVFYPFTIKSRDSCMRLSRLFPGKVSIFTLIKTFIMMKFVDFMILWVFY